jgi:hypothetical protein
MGETTGQSEAHKTRNKIKILYISFRKYFIQWVLILEADDHCGDGKLSRNYRSVMAVGLRKVQIVVN